MRLTQWTDYSLRVLMHCAAHEQRVQPITITDIVQAHGISRSHLTKIVMTLSAQGFIETSRGRGGGMRLKRPAASITVGEVVRQTETDFQQFECFNRETSRCRMTGSCALQHTVGRALSAYLAVLDGVTLADLASAPAPAADTPSTVRSGAQARTQTGWRIGTAP
ncbi:MAG: RrF2 family transcriptional regulator [Hydrogenophaga sp.]